MLQFNNVHALGFEEIERALQQVAGLKTNNYPPFNIERDIIQQNGEERLRVILAVAGIEKERLEVFQVSRHLIVKGNKDESDQAEYLHQGIATREFERVFLLAENIDVTKATLKDGLLIIELIKPKPEIKRRQIKISSI